MNFKKLSILFASMLLLASCTETEFTDPGNNSDNHNQNENNNDDDNNGNNNDDGGNTGGEDDGDDGDDIEYTYNYYENDGSFTSGAVKLSFNMAGNYNYLKGIDGKKVALKGFMFSASPVDGSFIFLSNMPYQSCPFCALNTSELSNCYEIYPKAKEKFSYTTSAIVIVGTLKVAPSKNQLFTDLYEYEFLSKIEDAEYKILKDSDQDANFTLRNKFANSTLLTELYEMLNYVNFVCRWPTYYVNSYVNSKGETVPGFYLYPADALYFLETDGAQWNYGYVEGYFDSLISKVNRINDTGFEDLIKIIQDCKATAEYALSELYAGHYTYKVEYVKQFDNEDRIYTLNDKSLETAPDELYNRFSYWLTSFEM